MENEKRKDKKEQRKTNKIKKTQSMGKNIKEKKLKKERERWQITYIFISGLWRR